MHGNSFAWSRRQFKKFYGIKLVSSDITSPDFRYAREAGEGKERGGKGKEKKVSREVKEYYGRKRDGNGM